VTRADGQVQALGEDLQTISKDFIDMVHYYYLDEKLESDTAQSQDVFLMFHNFLTSLTKTKDSIAKQIEMEKKKDQKSKPAELKPATPKLGQMKESKSIAKLRSTMTRTNLRNAMKPAAAVVGDQSQTRKVPVQRVKSWRFGAKGAGAKNTKDEQKVIESMIDDIIDSLAPTK